MLALERNVALSWLSSGLMADAAAIADEERNGLRTGAAVAAVVEWMSPLLLVGNGASRCGDCCCGSSPLANQRPSSPSQRPSPPSGASMMGGAGGASPAVAVAPVLVAAASCKCFDVGAVGGGGGDESGLTTASATADERACVS